jgi:hypothetical protein
VRRWLARNQRPPQNMRQFRQALENYRLRRAAGVAIVFGRGAQIRMAKRSGGRMDAMVSRQERSVFLPKGMQRLISRSVNTGSQR